MASDLIVKVVLQLQDELTNLLDGATKKVESFGEKAKSISRELGDFGRTIGIAGAAITGGLGVTVKEFATLESAAANLKSTMTSKDGLSGNFARINELAVQLGNSLPGTTADFYVMINKLLQLGVTEEAVLGGVGVAAAKLGAVMKLPYEQAAIVAAKLKEASGTSQEDMLKFMDTLQRVGHQGVEATEMMYAFARSAGAMKSFGVQGEEAARGLSAMFAQLLKMGMSGETIGTAMGTIFNALQKFETQDSEKMTAAADELEKLGIKMDFFDDKTQKFKGIDNMIAEFAKMQNIPQLDRGGILQKIFGGGQDQQIVSSIINGGTAANDAMKASLDKQADLATRSAVQLETLAAKWEASFGTFQNTLAKFGELLAPKLKELVDWFGDISVRLGKWIDENKGLATAIGTALGGIGAAMVAIGGVGLAAAGVAATFGAIASGWAAIAGALGAVVPVVTALAANPLVLAIMGVAVAGSLVYKYWDDIVAAIKRAMDSIRNVVTALIDKLQAGLDWVTNLGKKFMDAGRAIVQGLIDGVKERAQAAVEAVMSIGTSAIDGIKNLLKIRSPSQVMRELGSMTAAGFALGLAAGIPSVSTAAERMAQAAPTAAESAIQAAKDSGQGRNVEGISEVERAALIAQADNFHEQIQKKEVEHQERMFSIRSFFSSETVKQQKGYDKLNLDSSSAFFGQMGALMNTKSRSLFQIGKTAAIAQTIIDTYAGAQKAYTSLAGIPYVGPALGIAAAAAAVAAGIARVQAIKSTSFGTTSGSGVLSSGGTSGPVLAEGTSVALPPPPNSMEKVDVAPSREVNVFLRGDDIYSAQMIRDSLIPALNEALGDGVKLNVRGG